MNLTQNGNKIIECVISLGFGLHDPTIECRRGPRPVASRDSREGTRRRPVQEGGLMGHAGGTYPLRALSYRRDHDIK